MARNREPKNPAPQDLMWPIQEVPLVVPQVNAQKNDDRSKASGMLFTCLSQ